MTAGALARHATRRACLLSGFEQAELALTPGSEVAAVLPVLIVLCDCTLTA